MSGTPRLACDVHTHTLASRHAYSTIEENVRAAAERGLELLGSADHYASIPHPYVNGAPDIRDFQFYLNYGVWPRLWHGVQVLHGCEADIVDLSGSLFGHDVRIDADITGTPLATPATLKDMVFSRCDYVVASVHNRVFATGATAAEGTAMYLGALADPKVLILGHIGRAGVPFEVDQVVTAARDLGKLIEINEHSFAERYHCRDLCRHIAERCAELGCPVAVSSDAHIAFDVGRLDTAASLLAEIHFPERLVATRSADAFLEAMHAAVGESEVTAGCGPASRYNRDDDDERRDLHGR